MAITDDDLGFLLRQRLAAESAVTALVNDRIRPDTLATNEIMPAIRYEMISSSQWELLNTPPTDAQSRIQIDAYGATRLECNNLAEVIRKNLHGFSGTLGNIRIYDCFMDNRYDSVDNPEAGSSTWRKRRTMDFVISHSEPVPTL